MTTPNPYGPYPHGPYPHGADPCGAFRARLERALEGRPMPRELAILSWHEHLLGCGACRELLEREEALEALLASMPEPRLEPDLTRRVLARLRAQSDALDALLELDAAAAPPAGLAVRVLAGVRARAAQEAADARLDALLELDREVPVPAGLAARVLAALEPERFAPLRRFPSPRLLLAAAAGIAALALPLWLAEPEPPLAPGERIASLGDVPGVDAELRAFLAEGGLALLDEPLLWSPDEDLEIALATSLDPRYETVLDYDEPTDAEGAAEDRDG